jgi:hypothetical protein
MRRRPCVDYEEAVQQTERDRWHREEVEGDDRLLMISEKRQPIPFGIAAPPELAEIASDRSF